MKHPEISLAAMTFALAFALSHTIPAAAMPLTAAKNTVIVELFTSEGCSDCPDADRLLAKLVREQPVSGVQIIGLEEHIDYWNNAHWGDPYSSRLFSQRQYNYSSHFNDNSVYTPEMVVEGSPHFVGSDEGDAISAIEQESRRPSAKIELTQSLSGDNDSVSISVTPRSAFIPSGATVNVAVTEDGIWSHVSDGENAGRTLYHGSVVREFVTAGTLKLSQDKQSFTAQIPLKETWGDHPLSLVAFIQSPTSFQIAGSAIPAHPMSENFLGALERIDRIER